MVQYKKKYTNKIVGIQGFGNVNTKVIKPETIQSLASRYPQLIRLIESKHEKKSKK